jgi:hypothetical protein
VGELDGKRNEAGAPLAQWLSLRYAALSLSAVVVLLGISACGAVVVQGQGAATSIADQSHAVPADSATSSSTQQCTAGLRCAP